MIVVLVVHVVQKNSTLLLIGWLCCRSRSRSLQLSSPAVVTAPE
jgi:hypothetical protein